MKLYRTRGVIYRTQNINDNDKLVWILTENKGKITTIAKSIRNTKSRRGSHIDILNLNNFVLYKGKSMDTIRETNTIDSYSIQKSNNPYLFFYIGELVDKIEFEQVEAKKVFRLIAEVIGFMDKDNLWKLLATIELNLLKIIGFEPNLSTYLDIDKPLTANSLFLSFEQPGYTEKSNNQKEINPTTIKCQRILAENNLAMIKALKVNDDTMKEIREIHAIWIQNLLEKKINSLEFLKYNAN
jgi:DNA repair protein RecO (recombination protein O)